MIVALLNQKGGVGKITLGPRISRVSWRYAASTSSCWMPTRKARHWTGRSVEESQGLPRLFSTVGLARETLHSEAPALARQADHLHLDGAHHASQRWRVLRCWRLTLCWFPCSPAPTTCGRAPRW